MAVTISELRQNIYKLIDEVLETGLPLEIERKGQRLRIVPDEPPSKLARLVERPDFIIGDPEELNHIDWLSEWRP